jgi:signal transduction histidine kinase
LTAAIGLLEVPKTFAAPEASGVVSPTIITNLGQFWGLPTQEKNQVHHARIELLIYVCNPAWSVFWGQSDNQDTFLPLRGIPVPLKSGDKVLLEGLTLPVNEEFVWDKTSITILSESNSLPSISADGRLFDTTDLDRHMVEIEALVDSQALASGNILQLNLLAQNANLVAYVPLGTNAPMPSLVGKFVRIKGVYTETFDIVGKVATITLWPPGLNGITTIGSLESDERFSTSSIPLTDSENFASANPNALIRIQGVVRSQQPGQEVTIWDATGQIRILTKQQQVLKMGDRIEAIGYPSLQGIDYILQNGLFRVALNQAAFSTNQMGLHLAAQICGLEGEDLDTHPPVDLQGVVVWVDRAARYCYVLDSSGGIRVMQSNLENSRAMRVGMVVKVDGIAVRGKFAPVITNAVVNQTGSTSLPDAPLVSVDEAMTGSEDGHWIQMRGYVRKINDATNSIWLQLVASSGGFKARIPRDSSLETVQGSVILVKGVCVADANDRHQLTGVEIWSPEVSDVQIEQSPPADVFALPMRPLANLREFNPFNTLNQRVRTSGTVTLAVPGHYLYLQDSNSSLYALSEQTNTLRPGDRVEVVGFCGMEGGNFLLREAVYRRIASGSEPVPVAFPTAPSTTEEFDGLLTRSEGDLLDVVDKQEETDFVIQSGHQIFEAVLDKPSTVAWDQLQLGSRLVLTGVYRIQRDEYGNPHSFQLILRSGEDVRVLRPPPWWTPSRLLWVLVGALLVILVILLWAFQTRRQNRLLLQSQTELKTSRDKLEERVHERTRELSEQVKAKELAHERLSEAQGRLIVASRQAGMAEMATSVLHNVGNVLNSVNVSASVIGNSVQNLRIENLVKAVALLNEGNGDPVHFLTEDPRGRALPGYLRDLAGVMIESRKNLQEEVSSLVKQIDHVKAIVALQQDYAKNSTVAENLSPVEILEEAFEINRDAYERRGIKVVRQYENPPELFADRHKVLQILVNLLSNAQYALDKSPEKRVTLCIRQNVGNGRVHFEISDTGVGIAPENLERIFMLGFTTRADGHGFGLHSGANAAREMDGQLFVFSEGIGRGATFILELPVALKTCEQVTTMLKS